MPGKITNNIILIILYIKHNMKEKKNIHFYSKKLNTKMSETKFMIIS